VSEFLTQSEGEVVSSALYLSYFPQEQESTMQKHKVAVYGSLLSGFGNHTYFLEGDATKLSETKTASDEYVMVSLGGFPGVIDCTSEAKGKILVEIYEVDSETLRRLDGLEGHPNFYERKLLDFEDGTTAWMYIYQGSRGGAIEKDSNGDYSWRKYYAK
jgi:gamma-glutamylcyclotransferase (GGCT)/AIG2-like uncharacterized protein YtfP